jgi:hypothetical protein
MKKIGQITLTFIMLFALNVQLIDAQYLLDQTVKIETVNNTEDENELLYIGNSIEADNSEKSININKFSEQQVDQNSSTGESSRLMSDLLSADLEDDIQVENWMLNPCEWLCMN